MDGAQNSLGNAPQESSPAPAISSPAADQLAAAAASPARNSNELLDASDANPRENLVINPPVESSEIGASENDLGLPVVAGESSPTMQENKESHDRNNGVTLSESISPSTLETKVHKTSVSSTSVPQLHQHLEKENLDDNDCTPASPPVKNGSINHLTVEVATNSCSDNQSPDKGKVADIDTTSPFESVKAAVSKFGGIVDWKKHRAQTMEKRKVIEQELEKAHEEIPLYKKYSEDAEEAKLNVLKELENSKTVIEELKLELERAKNDEEQAKQDSQLAELRVAEMEQGIADDVSVAAKTQLEVARARHEAAVSELKTAKDELEQLKSDYALLLADKDASMKKMEEAISRSKEVEKSVEDLTIDLITAKESLEFAHAAHLEAEEHRIGAVMAKDQDILNWEKDLKQADEELERVKHQLLESKELKAKLDTATGLLQDLKAELAAYMDSKLEQESDEEGNLQDAPKEPRKRTREAVEAALSAAKKELEQVNINIEKATDEVNILMPAATSLKSELKKEKAELAAIQQREGMASIAVASLEAELNRTKSEFAFTQVQEKEQREKLVELPKQLQVVAQEADQAKEVEKIANDGLRKVREEAEQAKAGASTMKSRLHAVQKEIEAAKASEKLALEAMNALVESESAQRKHGEDSTSGVSLSLEEYYELSKKSQEAEEQATIRLAEALSRIEVAKESELESLNKLKQANRERAEKKEALQVALQKSEKAEEGKLGAEQELRKWRAENEQRRKAGDAISMAKNSNINSNVSFEERFESKDFVDTPNSSAIQLKSSTSPYASNTEADVQLSMKVAKKKKKFHFAKIFKFLGRKKTARSSKS